MSSTSGFTITHPERITDSVTKLTSILIIFGSLRATNRIGTPIKQIGQVLRAYQKKQSVKFPHSSVTSVGISPIS